MAFESIFTLQSAGSNTATFTFTYRTADLVLTNLCEQDWVLLPDGRLKDLLLTRWTYTPGGPTEDEQFYEALGKEGFSLSVTFGYFGGQAPQPAISLNASVGPTDIGWPFNAMPDGVRGVVHIALTHSIVR